MDGSCLFVRGCYVRLELKKEDRAVLGADSKTGPSGWLQGLYLVFPNKKIIIFWGRNEFGQFSPLFLNFWPSDLMYIIMYNIDMINVFAFTHYL